MAADVAVSTAASMSIVYFFLIAPRLHAPASCRSSGGFPKSASNFGSISLDRRLSIPNAIEAHIFLQLRVGLPPVRHPRFPGRRVGLRIVDADAVFENV